MTQKIDPHILTKFEVIKKIGSGSYGHVYKVMNKKTRQIKALKKNFDAFQNSTDAQRTYREIMFLMELKHPNIITLEEVIPAENGRDIYLVFEFMDADLHMLVHHNLLSEDHIKYVLYQVARALFFMHSAGLIHRDLKPSNVLVNESCEAKLADFGLVRSVSQHRGEKEDILTDYIATRWYRAPENILGSKVYSYEIDVWSFGCLAAEMIRKMPLFPGTSSLNQLQRVLIWTGIPSQKDQIYGLKVQYAQQIFSKLSRIKKINHSQFFQQINPDCLDLIQKCLELNPARRITMLQILQHPYLSQFYQKQQIIASKINITTPVDDSQRLHLKDYRFLIYNEIQKRFYSKKYIMQMIYKLKRQQAEQKQRISKYKMHYHRLSLKTQQSNLDPQVIQINIKHRHKKSLKKNQPYFQYSPFMTESNSQQLKKVSLNSSTEDTSIFIKENKKKIQSNNKTKHIEDESDMDKSLKNIKVFIMNEKLNDDAAQKYRQKMKTKEFQKLLKNEKQRIKRKLILKQKQKQKQKQIQKQKQRKRERVLQRAQESQKQRQKSRPMSRLQSLQSKNSNKNHRFLNFQNQQKLRERQNKSSLK